ncbi:MAG: hypothetical protein WCK96_10890 [Methylococcales bacterium]
MQCQRAALCSRIWRIFYGVWWTLFFLALCEGRRGAPLLHSHAARGNE